MNSILYGEGGIRHLSSLIAGELLDEFNKKFANLSNYSVEPRTFFPFTRILTEEQKAGARFSALIVPKDPNTEMVFIFSEATIDKSTMNATENMSADERKQYVRELLRPSFDELCRVTMKKLRELGESV